MSPVEGERSFGSLKSRMDSTEPGDRQWLTELEPGAYLLVCHEDDGIGALVTKEPDPNTKTFQKKHGKLVETSHPYIELHGGKENSVYLQKTDPNTGYEVNFEIWHQAGDAEQPPFRHGHVPVEPTPPLDEMAEALTPSRVRELVSAVSH